MQADAPGVSACFIFGLLNSLPGWTCVGQHLLNRPAQHPEDALFAVKKTTTMHRFVTLTLFCTLAGTLLAQPVLPITVEPVAGTTLSLSGWYPPSFFDPGPPGENQNWDFSSAGYDVSVTRTYLPPAGTSFADKFPAANLCMRTDAGSFTPPSFTYYTLTDSSISTLGLGILGSNIIINNTPWDRHYPMQYGESQSDSVTSTNTGNGQTAFAQLLYTRTYDAFGALTLPQGATYQNAIRVKTTAQRRDSVPGANNTYTLRFGAQEFYYWYVPNIYGYLFWTSKYSEKQLKINAAGDTTQTTTSAPVYLVEYQTDIQVKAGEPQTAGAMFEILGNPAREWLQIRLNRPEAALRQVLISDMAGRVQYQNQAPAADDLLQIPVHELPPGVYTVQVTDSKRTQVLLWEKI